MELSFCTQSLVRSNAEACKKIFFYKVLIFNLITRKTLSDFWRWGECLPFLVFFPKAGASL